MILMFMLRVMMYVVADILFWNWIGVVQLISLDLTNGLLLDTFFIVIFYNLCRHGCNH